MKTKRLAKRKRYVDWRVIGRFPCRVEHVLTRSLKRGMKVYEPGSTTPVLLASDVKVYEYVEPSEEDRHPYE